MFSFGKYSLDFRLWSHNAPNLEPLRKRPLFKPGGGREFAASDIVGLASRSRQRRKHYGQHRGAQPDLKIYLGFANVLGEEDLSHNEKGMVRAPFAARRSLTTRSALHLM